VATAHLRQVDAEMALNWQVDAAAAQQSSHTDVVAMLSQIVQVEHSTDE